MERYTSLVFEKAQYCKDVNPPQTGLHSKYDQNLNRLFFFFFLTL